MDREPWKRWVGHPTWPCPLCQKGSLRLIPGTVSKISSRKERLERGDPDGNHNETIERFTAHLKCSDAACAETATIAGNYYSGWFADGSEEGFNDTGYQALSIVPSPVPFRIDRRIPTPIDALVREAAALFWSDQGAAASRIREVIDAVLTDLGIEIKHSNGKRISLHQRIERVRLLDGGKWGEQADIVEAAKWIGNEGTHETVTREEVLDAFEMLETVLEDVYVKSRHALLEKARGTNAKYRSPKSA